MNGYTITNEDKIKIQALFELNEEDVEHKLENLKNWVVKNPQLPKQSQDKNFLDIMLLRSKFRDDYAKKNIENYFKYLNKYPEIFKRLGKFKPSQEAGVAIASPRLTPNYERVGILKLQPKNLSKKKFDINQMILITVTTGVIMYNNDYVPSVRFLLDFQGFTMLDLLKVNIRDLYKLVTICEYLLRIRISGFELLNAPSLVKALLGIGKMLLKPKMFARITTHSNIESIYKNIPRECLPSDYGGSCQSTEKLVELWDNIIESQQSFFVNIASLTE